MNERLFRKKALDRLSSPEQLDQLMHVSSPETRLTLVAFGLLFAALVGWGLFGTIYVEVGAQGVLLAESFEVQVSDPCRLTEVLVHPGQIVQAGEPIARVETSGGIVELQSQFEGRILELLALQGSTLEKGVSIASIQKAANLKAAVFVPAHKVSQILPGMQVYLSPVTAPSGRAGYLIGKVTAVASNPSTGRGLAALFDNPRFVESRMDGGPIARVDVDLLPDPATPSGYVWSSRQSPYIELSGGTPCRARIRLAARRPASLLFASFN